MKQFYETYKGVGEKLSTLLRQIKRFQDKWELIRLTSNDFNN